MPVAQGRGTHLVPSLDNPHLRTKPPLPGHISSLGHKVLYILVTCTIPIALKHKRKEVRPSLKVEEVPSPEVEEAQAHLCLCTLDCHFWHLLTTSLQLLRPLRPSFFPTTPHSFAMPHKHRAPNPMQCWLLLSKSTKHHPNLSSLSLSRAPAVLIDHTYYKWILFFYMDCKNWYTLYS